jgi:hypothetical protein
LANSFNKWCLLTTFGKQCPRACMKLFVLACRARATTLDYIHYTLFVIIFVMFPWRERIVNLVKSWILVPHADCIHTEIPYINFIHKFHCLMDVFLYFADVSIHV